MNLQEPQIGYKRWIPVNIFINGELVMSCKSIEEAYRYLLPTFNSVTKVEIFRIIIRGIYDHLPYELGERKYEFRTNEEIRSEKLQG